MLGFHLHLHNQSVIDMLNQSQGSNEDLIYLNLYSHWLDQVIEVVGWLLLQTIGNGLLWFILQVHRNLNHCNMIDYAINLGFMASMCLNLTWGNLLFLHFLFGPFDDVLAVATIQVRRHFENFQFLLLIDMTVIRVLYILKWRQICSINEDLINHFVKVLTISMSFIMDFIQVFTNDSFYDLKTSILMRKDPKLIESLYPPYFRQITIFSPFGALRDSSFVIFFIGIIIFNWKKYQIHQENPGIQDINFWSIGLVLEMAVCLAPAAVHKYWLDEEAVDHFPYSLINSLGDIMPQVGVVAIPPIVALGLNSKRRKIAKRLWNEMLESLSGQEPWICLTND